MKFLLFFVIISCFFISCKKDKSSDTLPPISQTGANTFGCKINDIVWVPYFQCAAFTGQCSEMQINFDHQNGSYFLPLSFQLGVERSNKVDNEGSFIIANFSDGQGNSSTISQIGNVFDSLRISCIFNNHLYTYYGFPGFSQHSGNEFIITKLDTVNKIMSGTFDFKLIDYPDSIVVTEGRFDLKINDYCRCTQ